MPISKASGQAVAPAAKGDLVVGSATNDAAVLSVGSNDQVLTADSSTTTGLKWAAASGGGITLLSTTSLSGTSTTVSSISQSYTNLFVLITAVTFSANANLRIRLNGTGSNNSMIEGISGGTATAFSNIQPSSSDYAGDSQSSYALQINNYTQTSQTLNNILFYGAHRGSSSGFIFAGGGYNGATAAAVTSIQVTTQNGTSTFSTGTIRIYGVK